MLSLTVSCPQLTLLKSRKSLRDPGNTAQEQLSLILFKRKRKAKVEERREGCRAGGNEGGLSVDVLTSLY